jgi:hypothetical protein
MKRIDLHQSDQHAALEETTSNLRRTEYRLRSIGTIKATKSDARSLHCVRKRMLRQATGLWVSKSMNIGGEIF